MRPHQPGPTLALLLRLACVTLAVSCAGSRGPHSGEPRAVPAEEPILVYDRFSSWIARDSTSHHLRVWQDGTALAQDPYAERTTTDTLEVWGLVTRQEIDELYAVLVDRERLTEIQPSRIKSARHEIALETGVESSIADAGSQRIRIRTRTGSHSVSVYAAELYEGRYPEITEYARFASCVRYLEGLRTELVLGGRGRMREAIRFVNDRLRERSPGSEPLGRSDFRESFRYSDGSGRVRWGHQSLVHPDTVETIWGHLWIDRRGQPQSIDLDVRREWRERTVREIAAEWERQHPEQRLGTDRPQGTEDTGRESEGDHE